MKIKKSKIIILIFGLLITFGYYFFYAAIPEARVATAVKGTAVNAVSGNVKVLAAMESLVKAQLAGDIQEIKAPKNTGSIKVEKGEVIAKLDTTELDQQIQHLKLRYEAALKRQELGSHYEKEKENLEQDLERLTTLHKNGEYPTGELEKRQRDFDRIYRLWQHELLSRKLEVELLELELDQRLRQREKMILRTPIDGLLTESYYIEGSHLFGSETVAKIISEDSIIEISVNEEDFPGIAIDQPVLVNFLGHGNQLVQGKVTSLLATANADTKRRSVFVQLDIPQEALTPGMTGQASITKATHNDVIIIPRRALIGTHVNVVNKGHVEFRKVTTGFIGMDSVEIREGLKEGDHVILDEVFSFKNGQRVKTKKSAS